MTWDFHFTARAQPMTISGCTQFELNDQGLITLHRDYWDAAQQVYEKVPLLGAVLRLIRRKLALPTLT
jgi:steroid delta-isomerase